MRVQKTAGVWLLDSSLIHPLQSSALSLAPSVPPCSPCLAGRAWDSGLALVSLSDLNEGGWMFAGVVTPCSNNSFLLPVSATDRATAGGRGRQGGRDSPWSQRDSQQNINKAFDIYCHIQREKKELGVCPRAGAGTLFGDSEKYLKVKADPLTWQFHCWILSSWTFTVALI